MNRLVKMMRGFFWYSIVPQVLMLIFIVYFYGTEHIFGFAAFVLASIACACADAYKIKKEVTTVKKIKKDSVATERREAI
jgi:hypothetical protein